MPAHDWTRVDDGTFHHFHNAWVQELCAALNERSLPPGYYAISEQMAGEGVPDVLTLHAPRETSPEDGGAGVATLETAPPKVYIQRQKHIAIRSAQHDLIAIIEIVSPGNKSSRQRFDDFLAKVASTLQHGVHILVVDLFPPTRRDPAGIHGAVWEHLGGEPYDPPAGLPLTLAAYRAGDPLRAFVEPLAIGQPLTPMPVYLDREHYVSAPLEESYQSAFDRVPRALRGGLES
jgi:hypothetical protein